MTRAEIGGRWRRPGRLLRDLEAVGLLAAVGVACSLLLLPRGDGLIGLPELAAGEIAPRTVKSPRAFSVVDPILTQETRERARANVRPVYDHLLGLAGEPIALVTEAVDVARTEYEGSVALAPNGERTPPKRPVRTARAAAAFIEALGLDLERPVVEPLVAFEQSSAVVDAASMLLEALFRRRLVSDPSALAIRGPLTVRSIDADGRVTAEQALTDKQMPTLLGPNQARAMVDALSAERLDHLPPRVRQSVTRVVKELLTPNLVPNAQETLRRRRMAWLLVKPYVVLVARGDRILRAGDRVTDRDLLVLRALMKLESPQARLQSVLGSALLGVLIAGLAYRSARYAYRHRVPKKRDLVFLGSCFVTFLLVMWVGFKVVEWLGETKPIPGLPPEAYRLIIPLSAVTIVVRLAAGPIAAAATAPVAGLLAGWMMDGDLDFAAYSMVGAFAAASTEPGAKRVVVAAGVRAGLAQMTLVAGTTLLATRFDLSVQLLQAGLAFCSGIGAALLARAVLPAVETLFGYTTPAGLAAFADAEHPLLRELLVEIPGTYHHSLHVGELAEAGARAIGSDRLLARVGGYLHDVGRLGGSREPEARRQAAAKLAGNHRFPPELAQILAEQPHERRPSADRRAKPRSRTSALVALADRVEGALSGREGEFADAAELEAEVRDEVRAAVASRLLDEAALELRELAAVSRAFSEKLVARFLRSASVSSPGLKVSSSRISGVPPS